ncbi:hypothetical protein JOY40_20050 [Bacillus tropicus]|uniref:Carbohydrate kinase FGGY N-terminal domain-containing protein n=1 Tax=Bacillus tropicus TaxID=2026188 RepID=A0A5C5A9K8_9BACI|nr:hypothetical protein BTXL6_20855 [Bacillus thuringiensis]OJD54274.1 hypothetical protein BAU24_02735 [Bacillus sp. L27]PJZ18884.1 hypothetical protein CEW46_26070 [Bacillus cereus]TNP15543.1 hypothetical protein FHY71_12155 [Bacillus tropicus]
METRGRVIGIDIGTTSAKMVVFTEKGKVIASHAIDYPIIQPNVGWAEQDPDVICAAVYKKSVSVSIEKVMYYQKIFLQSVLVQLCTH